mgnify:CR=1 FL=1
MKLITSKFELPVSTENEMFIPIIAKELGYDPALSEFTPEDYIKKYFNDFYDGIQAKAEAGLNRYFGEAGKETVTGIMGLYKQEVVRDVDIKNLE